MLSAACNIVNEGSTAYLTVEPLDKDGKADAPAAMSYRINDVDSGAVIREETAVEPATSVQIVLTPADNTILNDRGGGERRRVTVTATFGAEDAVVGEYEYPLRNLRFAP